MSRTVADVMTSPPIVVGATTPFKGIVVTMREHAVSALPVVDDDGRLVGIVSEADLLLKGQYASEEEARRLDPRPDPVERAKSEGKVAGDLMTEPVLTVKPETPLAVAARIIHQRNVKRLPVVDAERRVIGVVSRADLLKVFLRSDEDILADVEEAASIILHEGGGPVRVEVRDGMVSLSGSVEHPEDAALLVRLARSVDGVVGVQAELSTGDQEAAEATDGSAQRGLWSYP